MTEITNDVRVVRELAKRVMETASAVLGEFYGEA